MRSKKAFKNFIANIIMQLVTAIIGFILPRYFLTVYGSTINGLVSSLKQFISYINIVEAGVGTASIVALYTPLAKHDIKEVNAILSATRIFYKKSGYIFALLVVSLAITYPLFVNTQINYSITFWLVIILAGSGVIEFFIIGKYRVLLTADQKSYVVSILQTVATILNAVISIIFMKLGFNVVIVQAVAVVVYASRSVFLVFYVNKKYPYVNLMAKPDMGAIHKKWDVLFHQIAGLIVNNTPVVILTVFSNLKEVSVYSIYYMATKAVHLIVTSFNSGLMSGFGEVIAIGDKDTLQKSYRLYEYIYYLVLAWAYTSAGLMLNSFVQIYTRGVQDVNYVRPYVAILFIIVGVANNIRIPPLTIINAAGHFGETKYRALWEAIINLSVSVALVKPYGIIGVLLGSICSFAYRTIDFIIYTNKHIILQSSAKTLCRLINNIVLSCISIFLFIQIFKMQINNFIEWVLWSCIVGIVTLLIIVLGNSILEPDSMKEVLIRFYKINRSFKKVQHENSRLGF